MKKSDLKTGMIVTLNNGNQYIVMLQCLIGESYEDLLINLNEKGFMNLADYDEDLKENSWTDSYDICKIKAPMTLNIKKDLASGDLKTIWERKRQMTMEEIEEALGYPVEIVSKR